MRLALRALLPACSQGRAYPRHPNSSPIALPGKMWKASVITAASRGTLILMAGPPSKALKATMPPTRAAGPSTTTKYHRGSTRQIRSRPRSLRRQSGAGRCSECMFVRAQGCAALLERGASYPDDGGGRARSAAHYAAARSAVRGVDRSVGLDLRTPRRSDEEHLPRVGEIFLEEPLHLRGETGVFGHEVDLPVGGEAAEIEVGRAHFRDPAVRHEGLGVDHRPPVLEDPDPCLEELPVAGARGSPDPGDVVRGGHQHAHIYVVPRGRHQCLREDGHGEEVSVRDPKPPLHARRKQLEHAQGAHLARLLYDHPHRLFPG